MGLFLPTSRAPFPLPPPGVGRQIEAAAGAAGGGGKRPVVGLRGGEGGKHFGIRYLPPLPFFDFPRDSSPKMGGGKAPTATLKKEASVPPLPSFLIFCADSISPYGFFPAATVTQMARNRIGLRVGLLPEEIFKEFPFNSTILPAPLLLGVREDEAHGGHRLAHDLSHAH